MRDGRFVVADGLIGPAARLGQTWSRPTGWRNARSYSTSRIRCEVVTPT